MTHPHDHPLGCWCRLVPADSILVDPGMPGICDFIRRATLEGQIRTVPACDGRVYLIPVPIPGLPPTRKIGPGGK